MTSESAAITVAVCTYNRYDTLGEAVDSVLRQEVKGEAFHVLVVDNSDDQAARATFYEHAHPEPRVEVIYSSPPGLSRARNVAIRRCGTKYLAFLDDDAVAEPGWLAAILAVFREREGAAVVCGPILPIWPEERPEWLPRELEGCLTILDYGPADRTLGPNEHAYGANMAFVTEWLAGVGGFDEQLGRRGSQTLLSEEELQCQAALRAAGHESWYAAMARVSHRVQRERLTRNWFRSRMAWQAVSEALQHPPVFYRDWSLREVVSQASRLGAGEGLASIFRSGGAESLRAQAELVRHLVSVLLFAKGETDESLDRIFGLGAVEAEKADLGRGEELVPEDTYVRSEDRYVPCAAVASSTTCVFVEATPGHRYLFDLYGNLPGSQLVSQDADPWAFDEQGRARTRAHLQYVYRSVTSAVENVVFLTLDPYVYGPAKEEFQGFLRAMRKPVSGILHRSPQTEKELRALSECARELRSVLCLSEEMARHLGNSGGIGGVTYLPHHPVMHGQVSGRRQALRRELGIPDGQVVLSIIGEARRGKGLELVLESLSRIPGSQRGGMFFVFAGKARDYAAIDVRRELLTSGVEGWVDLRDASDTRQYAVLTDREYAGYLAITDIGLLVYQDGQRHCMSGVLPDFAWMHTPVVATGNSYVGREVLRHELGVTLDDETPDALAKLLVDIVRMRRAGRGLGPKAEVFRESISPAAVVARLGAILARGGEAVNEGDGDGGERGGQAGHPEEGGSRTEVGRETT